MQAIEVGSSLHSQINLYVWHEEVKMKYYKYKDDYAVFSNAITFIEVKDGYAQRQITTNGESYISSNTNDIEYGLILADGYYDNDSIADVIQITKDEFKAVWQQWLIINKQQWEEVKNNYRVGKKLTGYIYRIFPQGVIVIVDKDTLGVVNLEECRKSAKDSLLISYGHPIIANVNGYDEENQWLILETPEILQTLFDYDELKEIIYKSIDKYR